MHKIHCLQLSLRTTIFIGEPRRRIKQFRRLSHRFSLSLLPMCPFDEVVFVAAYVPCATGLALEEQRARENYSEDAVRCVRDLQKV
jgi:hypothetical protein